MTEYTYLEAKDAVHERDGNRCRDCGVSEEDHRASYGRDLDVHRLLPGSAYHPSVCVLLCHACHVQKPARLVSAVFGDPKDTGVDFFAFNLYLSEDRYILDAIYSEAVDSGKSAHQVIHEILLKHVAAKADEYAI